jgi:hypothetical protein
MIWTSWLTEQRLDIRAMADGAARAVDTETDPDA